MRKIIAALLCCAMLLCCTPVYAAESGTPVKGDQLMVSVSDWLNMRSQPGTDSEIIAKLSSGTIVTLAGDYGEWVQVTHNGKTGWVASKYLKDMADFSTDHAKIFARLDELRAKFPAGKYWNHYGSDKANPDGWTETPCPSGHYLNGVQQCNGQCDGFARKLGLDLFGLSTYKWQNTSYSIDTICVGDLIRYNGKHTIMVVGFTSNPNELIIADCNWDYHCVIRWDASFSTSRYFSTVNWVLHYPGNTLNRAAYLNPAPTTTTTTSTTTTTAAITTTTTTTTTNTTTTAATTTTTTTTASPSSGNTSVAEIIRLGGKNRYETAAVISSEGWDSADTVVITSAMNFADALAAVPLAYALDAPILLVDGKSLGNAAGEIERLGANNAYIIGGKSVVSEDIQKTLEKDGMKVTRISGADRYKTAEKIAEEMGRLGAVKSDTVFFAYGFNYPDALAVSSVAAVTGSPILYAPQKGKISSDTIDCARKLGASDAVVLGGKGAIGDDVLKSISDSGLTVSRCGGTDRYDTAVNVGRRYSSLFSGEAVCFATGKNYPDALAGGVLAAKKKAPVVLVDANAKLDSVKSFVGSVAPDTVYVFGGSGVLGDALVAGCIGSAVRPAATTATTTTTIAAVTTTTATAAAGSEVYHIHADTIVYHAGGYSKVFHRSEDCSSMNSPVGITYSKAVQRGLRPCKNCCANCVYDQPAA